MRRPPVSSKAAASSEGAVSSEGAAQSHPGTDVVGVAVPPGSGAMFDGIAARYDLLNRIISLGLDGRWRRKLVASLMLSDGQRVLDLATGTGDVARALVQRNKTRQVVGLDPSGGMLEVAHHKLSRFGARVVLVQGDAQLLPFPDRCFDAVAIAFGIRNVPDRPRALREMHRVLVPGGRLGILELAEPQPGVLGSLARFHVRGVVPRIGALLSGRREYAYLEQSIARFPHHSEFARTMADAGFREVRARPMTFGACVLFEAQA